jgi:hypothetical protein
LIRPSSAAKSRATETTYYHLNPAYTPELETLPPTSLIEPSTGLPWVIPTNENNSTLTTPSTANGSNQINDFSSTTSSRKSTSESLPPDQRFMALLLLLTKRADFHPFTRRDAQLGISLNTDYLWQLFVKTSSEGLDRELLEPWLTATGAHELPQEAEGVLIFR